MPHGVNFSNPLAPSSSPLNPLFHKFRFDGMEEYSDVLQSADQLWLPVFNRKIKWNQNPAVFEGKVSAWRFVLNATTVARRAPRHRAEGDSGSEQEDKENNNNKKRKEKTKRRKERKKRKRKRKKKKKKTRKSKRFKRALIFYSHGNGENKASAAHRYEMLFKILPAFPTVTTKQRDLLSAAGSEEPCGHTVFTYDVRCWRKHGL